MTRCKCPVVSVITLATGDSWSLDELFWAPTCDDPKTPITDASEAIMNKDWSDWPDHYRHGAEEKRTIDVSSLTKPKPFKMNRRI